MTKRLLIIDGTLDRSVYGPVEQWATCLDDVPFDAIHLPSGESALPLDPYTHLSLAKGQDRCVLFFVEGRLDSRSAYSACELDRHEGVTNDRPQQEGCEPFRVEVG